VIEQACGVLVAELLDALPSGYKGFYSLAEFVGVVQGTMPERRYVSVKLHEHATISKTLHDGSERNDSPAAERFKQDLRALFPEPFSDVRNEPGLAARIAQG